MALTNNASMYIMVFQSTELLTYFLEPFIDLSKVTDFPADFRIRSTTQQSTVPALRLRVQHSWTTNF